MMGAPAARDTVKAVREQLFAHGRPQGLLPAL
jgi:pimeloyl-[acyl-carrier protein] methyl ester esterase